MEHKITSTGFGNTLLTITLVLTVLRELVDKHYGSSDSLGDTLFNIREVLVLTVCGDTLFNIREVLTIWGHTLFNIKVVLTVVFWVGGRGDRLINIMVVLTGWGIRC